MGSLTEPINSTLPRVTRSGNTQILDSDNSKFIEITAGAPFTQTFDSPTNLRNGWFCYYKNSTSSNITIPSSDGLTNWICYPGETRLFQVNSGNSSFLSTLIDAGNAIFQTTGSFVVPPGLSWLEVENFGAGGGGGGGNGNGGGAPWPGGSGGGGGARTRLRMEGAQIPTAGTSISIGIGAGGTGGAGGVAGAGSDGTSGGNTTFGAYLTAFGGGPGVAWTPTNTFTGGSGGGSGSAGNAGASAAVTGVNGGEPKNANYFGGKVDGSQNNTGGGGAGCVSLKTPGCAEWGGGAGGYINYQNGFPIGSVGGGSLFGGPGGGAGGGIDQGSVASDGFAAGGHDYSAGTGVAGGAKGSTGSNGTSGANGSNGQAGGAGGGGGAGTAGVGGNGGNGGNAGGGGGGGGGGTAGGGAGGNGGNGECRITWG